MSQRYVHVITNFGDVGGAEMMLARVINNAASSDYHIVISLMQIAEKMKEKVHNKNVEYYALNHKTAFGLILSIFKLRKLLNKYINTTSIFSWMYHANFITALAHLVSANKQPLFWGVRHSLDDFSGEKLSTKIAILAGRLVSFLPKGIIHCSNRALLQHCDFGYGNKSQSIYIPNGYSFNNLIKRDFGCVKFIGAAGRFHDAKDYYTLFKAAAPILKSYPNIKLKIVGKDIDNNNLHLASYIKELNIHGDQVLLLGQQKDMEDFYNSIDFFVLSSKTEGFPNVLAEASGYGCICFSTDVGDASEIIDSTRIVNIADSKALTKLIEKYMAKPPEELVEISNSSANYVRKNFAIKVIAKKLYSLGQTK